MTPGRWLGLVAAAVAVAAGAWWFLLRNGPTVDPTGPLSGPPGVALLIPGHGGNGSSLDAVAQALSASGWTAQTVNIGDGSGDIRGYADAVTSLAQSAAQSGARVILIGYSEGGLIARSAVSRGAAASVARVITIGTPHSGTSLAGLGVWSNSGACDTACSQMAPGSDFLDGLPTAGDQARWLALYSDSDDVVRPSDSGSLDGATNARLQDFCAARSADHSQLVREPFVTAAVVSFAAAGAVAASCG